MTFRAILYGLCLSVGVSLLSNTARYLMHSSYMAVDLMPMGNLLLFLLSVLGCAALSRWFGRRFALSSSEWITVFCMGFISALGPTYGISGYLVSIMTAPYYFATTENRWAETLHPFLPTWLIPTNEDGAITHFFEGLPPGGSIPWGVWVLPLFWWLLFICALAFAFACVAVLLHRQWADHERLVYPALTPVLEMTTGAGTGGRALPEFMKGRVFWAGFGLVTLNCGWNMISWFYPQFPTLPTSSAFYYWFARQYPPLIVFVSTVVICFSYFASLEVLFSLWFFDLLYIFEAAALNRIGIVATSPHYGAGPYTTTTYRWQTAGAFVVLVLWWLWTSRLHLREVLRKALHPDRSPLDDSRELISYRGAVVGLVVSCLYIAFWLGQVGVEVKMIALLIPAMFLITIGLAKIMADSGLIYLDPPVLAWDFSLPVFGGGGALNVSTRATYGLLSFTVDHPKGYAMPTLAHIARLGDFITGGRRRLFGGICAAFVVGVVVSTVYTVWIGYTIGAYNVQPSWLLIQEGEWQYGMTVSEIRDPRPMDRAGYGLFLAGAGAMAFLNAMRYRFVRWPFHPVGFALSGTMFARRESITLLVAWLIKLIMLKTGGVAFYRRSKPFFVGMLIGFILAVVAGLVIDALWFPGQGHIVHQWY